MKSTMYFEVTTCVKVEIDAGPTINNVIHMGEDKIKKSYPNACDVKLHSITIKRPDGVTETHNRNKFGPSDDNHWENGPYYAH